MEKNELIIAVFMVSILLILLVGFLLFILFWQRSKSNKFILERETMKNIFNEQLLLAQLEIQEQTFNTISMEIHDNVGQTLSLLNVQLNIVDNREQFDKILLSEARENARKAMTDLRNIAGSLNAERIQQESLQEMTAHELQRVSLTGIMQISLESEGDEQAVKADKKLIVFRIIQEGLQNIIKHAQAEKIKVNFLYADENLCITIQDDGQGFDETLLQENRLKGIGLKNILKRAHAINGSAQIDSVLGQGTTITIITPYV
jgi:signal transduction histidine kinase